MSIVEHVGMFRTLTLVLTSLNKRRPVGKSILKTQTEAWE